MKWDSGDLQWYSVTGLTGTSIAVYNEISAVVIDSNGVVSIVSAESHLGAASTAIPESKYIPPPTIYSSDIASSPLLTNSQSSQAIIDAVLAKVPSLTSSTLCFRASESNYLTSDYWVNCHGKGNRLMLGNY